ncbi:Uncharacterised protein [Legionella moravica]|uniref:Uncharacterized protein n=1 Tax=Legionella moravica TaxID=39962 RepID=A0A378JUI5_9GAMM|nr:Uncharacterised protein [Legionella moravica]
MYLKKLLQNLQTAQSNETPEVSWLESYLLYETYHQPILKMA